MALIKCLECGREISSECVTCPGCGWVLKPKQSRANSCLAVAGCVFGFFVIMATLSQNHSVSPSQTSSPNSLAGNVTVASATPNQLSSTQKLLDELTEQYETAGKQ